jgi:hypothetical protein
MEGILGESSGRLLRGMFGLIYADIDPKTKIIWGNSMKPIAKSVKLGIIF